MAPSSVSMDPFDACLPALAERAFIEAILKRLATCILDPTGEIGAAMLKRDHVSVRMEVSLLKENGLERRKGVNLTEMTIDGRIRSPLINPERDDHVRTNTRGEDFVTGRQR